MKTDSAASSPDGDYFTPIWTGESPPAPDHLRFVDLSLDDARLILSVRGGFPFSSETWAALRRLAEEVQRYEP